MTPTAELAHVAVVAEDGAEVARIDCEDGVEQECILTITIAAPDTYDTTRPIPSCRGGR